MSKQLLTLLSQSTKDLAGWLKGWTEVSGHDYYLKIPPGAKKTDKRTMLVAHIDKSRTDKEIDVLFDKKYQIYWSPQGLGADDRAGVYGILQIYNRLPANMKPYLLFCDKEESGGVGAKEAAEDLKHMAKRISFMIELDRKGTRDAVFYNDESSKFKKYIEKFGFERCFGTYSDISTIGKAWRIASVNLSCGYFDQHTLYERLEYEWLKETIKDAELLVRDAAVAKTVWNLPKPKPLPAYNDYRHSEHCICWNCKLKKSREGEGKRVLVVLNGDWVYRYPDGRTVAYEEPKTDLENYHSSRRGLGWPDNILTWFYCKPCDKEYIEDHPYVDQYSNSWCPSCGKVGEFAGQEFNH